jgi:hypothetical protein
MSSICIFKSKNFKETTFSLFLRGFIDLLLISTRKVDGSDGRHDTTALLRLLVRLVRPAPAVPDHGDHDRDRDAPRAREQPAGVGVADPGGRQRRRRRRRRRRRSWSLYIR